MKMRILIFMLAAMVFCGCAAGGTKPAASEQVVRLKIEGVDNVQIDTETDAITRTMQMTNPEGVLSQMSFISHQKAFMKIFSGLSISDVTRLWNDFCVLENTTAIRDVELFINSPGGDAFSGLALADEIERARRKGFRIQAHASGIVASAAVPVLAACDVRLAAPGTIFMVHEAALWKWPGRETASDIRSQNEMMGLLRERYIGMLVKHSKLDKDQWEALEKKTTWFSADKALERGLIDKIE